MPSTGSRPKHISLAWTSYKQGNEKHMLGARLGVKDHGSLTVALKLFPCSSAVAWRCQMSFRLPSFLMVALPVVFFSFFLPLLFPDGTFFFFFFLFWEGKREQAGKVLGDSFSQFWENNPVSCDALFNSSLSVKQRCLWLWDPYWFERGRLRGGF